MSGKRIKAVPMTLLLLVSALAALSPNASAIEPDARSFAMGGAYTAVARGVSCTYWNPAGFADSPWFEVTGSIGASVLDVEEFRKLLRIKEGDESITAVDTSVELGLGGGASLKNIGLGTWVIGNMDVAGDKDRGTLQASAEFRGDLAFAAGAGLPLKVPGVGPLSVGVAVKRVELADGEASQSRVNESDPDFTVTTTETYGRASGYAMDIGLRAEPVEGLTVALVAKDIGGNLSGTKKRTVTEQRYVGGQPQEPYKTSEPESSYSKQLTTRFRAGVAYRPLIPGLLLAADFEGDGTIRAGCEYALPARILILRGGAILSPNQDIRYRAGAGIRFGMINVDLGVGLNEGKSASVMIQGGLSF